MAKNQDKDRAKSDSGDVMNVRLTVHARATIESLTSRYLSQKTKLVERVLTWFSDQPESVQHVILTSLPDDLRPAYIDALRKIADNLEEDTRPPRITSSKTPGEVLPPLPKPPAPKHPTARGRGDAA